MPYIPPEIVEQARQIDLLTYLQSCEPQELVRISGNNYTTRTHDSLKISNGKWMWWSQRIGGYNALDYLVKVKGCSFVEAVETLMGKAAVMPSMTVKPKQKTEPKVLLLPDKSASTERITEYLFGRGIDYSIIQFCIDKGLIFESLPYHNLVCVGFDDKNIPRYASYRATNDRRVLGDCSGSDKHYSFRIADSDSGTVHLFECAIDLLSYATLEKIAGREWRTDNLVSLAGVYLPKEKIEDSTTPAALVKFLSDKPQIKKIFLHFDNDNAGRKASLALTTILPSKYEVIDSPPPCGKDYNDFLCFQLGIAKGAITYGMELMLALFNIIQGTISTIMGSAGFGSPQQTVLPAEMITTIEDCGFFESIPLWAVTLIGGLFITVMSFILIMTVYGRFFKLYMYTALAPIPLSTFAGEPSQNVGKSFIKSYCAVCLEGAVIVLSCIIFSLFASSPPVVNPDAAAVTQVWSYVGELLFNMLVLVGSVKMSDRIIREMMGL